MVFQTYRLVFLVILIFIGITAATEELNENDMRLLRENVKQRRFLVNPGTTSHLVNHTVELLIFIDYKFYSGFYNKTTHGSQSLRVQKAKEDIKQYVGVMMDSVNIVYQSLDQYGISIRIEPVAIIILTTRAASPWTEQNVFMNGTRQLVNAGLAIDQLEAYVDSHKGLPKHDHAMIITGYNMEHDGDEDVIGLATLGRMCKKKSGSVIQGDFYFRTSFAMAHEIGHSLGSEHDGDGNDCDPDGGYTMDTETKRYQVNSWIFSNCSAKYIKDDIEALNRHNQNCLLSKEYTSAIDTALNRYSHMLYGMSYTVDEQCQLIYGPDSYFKRVEYNSSSNYETLCINFYCHGYNTENDTTLSHIVDAGDGTSCGNQKWCMAGYCVDSPDAPKVSADCPFGDSPGLIKFNRTCSDLVQSRPQECYNIDMKHTCCKSCQGVQAFNTNKQHIPSADQQCQNLYGTKSRFCQNLDDYATSFEPICKDLYCEDGEVCHSVLAHDGTTCGQGKWCVGLKCVNNPNTVANETCLFGDQSSECPATIPDKAHSYLCYVNTDVCCGTCKKYINPNDKGNCTYGDKEKWCATLTDGHLCYKYSNVCCETCQRYYDPVHKDTCMYGDIASDCRTVIPDKAHSYYCYQNTRKCCKTCEAYKIPNDTGNCTYGDKARWCASSIPDRSQSYYCYKNDDNCCETCKAYFDSTQKGCEYGDRTDTCDRSKCHTYTDDSRTRLCCKTCRGV